MRHASKEDRCDLVKSKTKEAGNKHKANYDQANEEAEQQIQEWRVKNAAKAYKRIFILEPA